MPRYKIQLFETARYDCEVVARSEAAAVEKAEAMFLDAIEIGAPWSTTVIDRDVVASKKRKR